MSTWVASHPVLAGAAALLGLTFAYLSWSTRPDTAAPDLPGPAGWPIVGNIFQRGTDAADTYYKWSKKYGAVFKVRLGSKWAVVINSADAADELLAGTYAGTFQSRPIPYSFGQLLKHSSMRTITMGSSPYDDVLKTKRRLAIQSVSPAVAHRYDNTINVVANDICTAFDAEMKSSGGIVDPTPIMIRNSRSLAVGVHFAATPAEIDEAFKDTPFPMKRMAQVRNINGRLRDYLPFLRMLPESATFNEAVAVAKYRNEKLNGLLENFRRKYAAGEAEHCAAGVMEEDNKIKISEEAHISVSNSMISSGLESHMPNILLWSLGALATMPEVQKKCREAVARRATLDDTIQPEHDADDYLMAFVKESGRYFTTLRLSIARETMEKDITYNGHYIPKGTLVLFNAHAANRDESRFAEAHSFKPERYMSGPEAERGLSHYGFGQGRRICPAIQLVHRELYIILGAIVAKFQVDIHDGVKEFDPVDACADGMAFNQGPKQYRVRLSPAPVSA